MRVSNMKQYTLNDTAVALGVDIQTLSNWLAQGHVEPAVDPRDPQQYFLDQNQVDWLAREHNIGILPEPTTNGGSEVPKVKEMVSKVRPVMMDAPIITIGRNSDNTVVLDHPQVSAYHARLEQQRAGSYRIVDLGSTNHVYVNAQRVRSRVLTEGDEIRIGPFRLAYNSNQLAEQDESNVRIDALHLKKSGKRWSILLDDISLSIPPHAFVALVGGSGVGKSTLLDALSGIRPADKGLVLYNGQDYYRHLDAFSTQLGYVPQDDIIHRRLTVEHALYYTARMRLPRDFTRAQIRQRIDEVLDDVEMRPQRKSLVSRLSGGQRKRVSLALELLANPSVFFLDEPTASLDPGLDRKMMFLLRKLANEGHTIVLVTHANENIDVCDHICFLARGGRLAFYGKPEEAKTYFGTPSFAEMYNALEPTEENKDISRQAEERFQQSAYFQKYVSEPLQLELANRPIPIETREPSQQSKRGKPARQFAILTRRYLELLKNDIGSLLLLLLQAPIIGLILFFLATPGAFFSTSVATCPTTANPLMPSGRIVSLDCQRVVGLLNSPEGTNYVQQNQLSKLQVLQDAISPNSGINAQTLLFIMAFAAVLFGCVNGVREIVKERPIYRRERLVNLGIVPYLFSKIFVLGIVCLLQCAILVYLLDLKAPLHQGIFLPILAEIYITMALTSLASLMLGLAVSALAPTTDRAMTFLPLLLLPQVIFSGIIFKLDTPLLQGLGSLFAARWAMAGMGSSVGLHADKLEVDNFSYQGTLFTSLDRATAVPGATAHLLLVWGVLLGMIIILGFATAYFLKRGDVRK